MKELILGIDTSCYTTSLAVMSADGEVLGENRKLLEVPAGKRGLSQSEMVFQHIKALPMLFEKTFSEVEGQVKAIGASGYPRRQEGSYMPVFLAGTNNARSLAAALKVPLFLFSHQEGHIWASLQEEIFQQKVPCYGVQSSGGTLEGIRIGWTDGGELDIEILWETADISVGQLIDRIGVRNGLPFPAGPHYPAVNLLQMKKEKVPVSIKGNQIFLAGAETHLIRAEKELEESLQSALYYSAEALRMICERLGSKEDRIIMVGGVLANSSIRSYLEVKVQADLFFPEPQYNSDNAVGIARAALESWRRMKNRGNK